MLVSVVRSAGHDPAQASIRLRHGLAPHSAPLTHPARIGAGVHLDVDPLHPGQWHGVSVSGLGETSVAILEALIGAPAAKELVAGERFLELDQAGLRRWRRVGAVDALDRWLHLPLDQALIDAERAVTIARAGRPLLPSPGRTAILGTALHRARDASSGFVLYLQELAASPVRLPPALRAALRDVVNGYAELVRDVTGSDRQLSVVGDTWQRLFRRRSGPLAPVSGSSPAFGNAPSLPAGRWMACMIDPRQLRARVLGLSCDPARPEMRLSVAGPNAVHVRIPAFGRCANSDDVERLAVRVVDRTARSHGHALLSSARGGAPAFEVTISLRGLDARDVRVDVFDALRGRPPANVDTDASLLEARRAVVLLGEWRRLAAESSLAGEPPAVSRRLVDLAALMRSETAADDTPAFPGGPSPAGLRAVSELADVELGQLLRGSRGAGMDVFPATSGPARPLLAELAACHAG